MAYVGTPLDTRNTFQSLQGKRFNGDGSTTDFTLDVAPGNVLDIEVFVGNVRQDPNSAYTVSGTTLSFTGAPPSGTNNIYVVHQAKSVGTIDVPAGGVAADSLATSVLTGQTDIGAAIADADLFLVDDGAGGTLRKTAASRIKTYVGDNTPSFSVKLGSNQTISNATDTKITLDTESWDTDSAFASNKFTVPSGEGGKYLFVFSARTDLAIDTQAFCYVFKNGSQILESTTGTVKPNATCTAHMTGSVIVDLAVSDYIELYIFQNSGSSQLAYANYCSLMGCKLIGV